MTELQEKRIVYVAGMIGFFGDKANWKDVYCDEQIDVISKNLEKLINYIVCDVEQAKKLCKDVMDGVYEVKCYKNYEIIEKKRRMLKSRMKVDRESLYTIAEHAMQMCEDCKRLKSKCMLRKALLKCEIPTTNDGNGKCEFNWRDS